MSHLALLQGLLLNLKGEIEEHRRREFVPKEKAYRMLKYYTGQDFGEDVSAWQAWIRSHPKPIKAVGSHPNPIEGPVEG